MSCVDTEGILSPRHTYFNISTHNRVERSDLWKIKFYTAFWYTHSFVIFSTITHGDCTKSIRLERFILHNCTEQLCHSLK